MKQTIVGIRNNSDSHVFLRVNEDGTADWVSEKEQATLYDSMDLALVDWFALNKSAFRRLFIANAE